MRWLVFLGAAACGGTASNMSDGPGSSDASTDGSGSAGVDGALADAPMTCPANQWCQETAPSGSTRLTSVWAVNAGDVFAVGDGGTILRRTAGTWTQMTSQTTANLSGVWAHDGSNVWAVGAGGVIVHWNGTAWAVESSGTTADLTAVWGSSASDVWVVGSGADLHYVSSAWTKPTPQLGGTLLSITGTGANDVWVCGEGAYVRHYTGSWSSPISPVTGNDTYFAIAADASEVWVSSAVSPDQTEVLTGSSWTAHATTSIVFEGLYAAAPGDVWGVAQTKVGHWTGSSWSVAQPMGVSASLWGVSGSGADVWVVGDGGMILHRD